MIEENYMTGEYKPSEAQNEKELYQKYMDNVKSVLPYQWGVWVTSLAFANLFKIGSYAGVWIYSDTDSCYGMEWDTKDLAEYNESCKARLRERGYGAVIHDKREYWPGICELDGKYCEFISVGAKRYAVRKRDFKFKIKNGNIKSAGYCIKQNSGKKWHALRYIKSTLKITVAGVPKSGVRCLKNDIRNFHANFVFDGETTGKMKHKYFYEDDIYNDQNGNERGDSIDLSPTTYVLDSERCPDWQKLLEEEISIRIYE